MKVNYKGKDYEAFSLVMKKENALEILNGTKRIETRAYSDKYFDMFIDKKKLEEQLEKAKRGETDFEDYFKPIAFVHFYSITGKWYLDVAIDVLSEFNLQEKADKDFMNENGFHDFDADFDAHMNDNPKNGDYMFFAMRITKVIASEGLQ